MQSLPNLQFFYNNTTDTLNVVLHGGREGIDSALMQKLILKSRNAGHSAVAFNFPFLDRGEDHSSNPELTEELAALHEILSFVHAQEYGQVHIIAKSFGGIVASYFLKSLPSSEHNKYCVTILGYVKGDIDLKTFTGKIHIIQGEMDRFGNIEAVKEDLQKAVSNQITFTEIAHADHSYKDSKTKEYTYEDNAVREVIV